MLRRTSRPIVSGPDRKADVDERPGPETVSATAGDGADESPTMIRRELAPRSIDAAPTLTPTLTIEIEREPNAGERRFVHKGEVCRIGTHSSNDLVLRDPTVSRFHCKLTRLGVGWKIEDSGSRNGTRLDGVRVRDADLGSEGLVTLGDTVLRVRSSESAEQVALPNVESFGAILGGSVAMRKLFACLERVAASDINVLIEGESGTGKELVAAEIVARGARAEAPFIVVDCSAISPTLVESELFGHIRGAFTGAERERVGAFEMADGGTIFLDEIGELPLELQPKLLRVLEAREVRRVGDARPRKVNVRVIAATNRDLAREVNRGRFREDLYFRLAVMTVRVPPLRERLDDVPLLVRGFLSTLSTTSSHDLFPSSVLAELATHDWPGNVRELRNYVERATVMREPWPAPPGPASAGGDVDMGLPFKVAKDAVVDAFERKYLQALLDAAGGNVSKAARSGGIDRMYLHRLMQKHGLRSYSRTTTD